MASEAVFLKYQLRKEFGKAKAVMLPVPLPTMRSSSELRRMSPLQKFDFYPKCSAFGTPSTLKIHCTEE